MNFIYGFSLSHRFDKEDNSEEEEDGKYEFNVFSIVAYVSQY